jgi:hypothetical protein
MASNITDQILNEWAERAQLKHEIAVLTGEVLRLLQALRAADEKEPKPMPVDGEDLGDGESARSAEIRRLRAEIEMMSKEAG